MWYYCVEYCMISVGTDRNVCKNIVIVIAVVVFVVEYRLTSYNTMYEYHIVWKAYIVCGNMFTYSSGMHVLHLHHRHSNWMASDIKSTKVLVVKMTMIVMEIKWNGATIPFPRYFVWVWCTYQSLSYENEILPLAQKIPAKWSFIHQKGQYFK